MVKIFVKNYSFSFSSWSKIFLVGSQLSFFKYGRTDGTLNQSTKYNLISHLFFVKYSRNIYVMTSLGDFFLRVLWQHVGNLTTTHPHWRRPKIDCCCEINSEYFLVCFSPGHQLVLTKTPIGINLPKTAKMIPGNWPIPLIPHSLQYIFILTNYNLKHEICTNNQLHITAL